MSDSLEYDGFSISDWVEAFDKSTSETRRDAKKILRQGAKLIMSDSQKLCPVDEHNLEEAHHIEDVTLNMNETNVTIAVGGIVNGRDVDDYAAVMHEGFYTLGEGSLEKQASNSLPFPVGRKYLENAASLHEDDIVNEVADAFLRDFNVD